jgi:glutathione synthase/RimK-type ligase-like ATP-grasp enzyme
MDKKDAYMWYSGPTDVTGRALVEKLGITGGLTKPNGSKKMVIGWGTKTKDSVTFTNGAKVLNHPNLIKRNRNKFNSLEALRAHGVPVADFCSANDVLDALADADCPINAPLVGRTNYHQSGKNFWLCVTGGHVIDALEEGAQYFQNFIDVKDEYRLHVFGDKVVHAVKKVKRNDVEEAFVKQHGDKISDKAEKNNLDLDRATVDYVLKSLALDNPRADMIVRSNRRGWKFSPVSKYPKQLSDVAIAALKATGLDFGAVDCCVDAKNRALVLEINTGPGLEGKSLEAYVNALEEKISEAMNPKAKKRVRPNDPRERKKSEGEKNTKERLAGMADMFSMMVAEADETESETLEKIFKRMMG